MFEVLGSWVATESQAEARLMFDVQSRQHAWHAQLWADRLPAISGVIDPDLATAPLRTTISRSSLRPLADQRPEPLRGGGTLLRLVGLSRVVFPRVSSGYALHLRRAVAVSDSAVVRALAAGTERRDRSVADHRIDGAELDSKAARRRGRDGSPAALGVSGSRHRTGARAVAGRPASLTHNNSRDYLARSGT